MTVSGYCAGHTLATDHLDLEERAHRARRIARVLRHDIDSNPPIDAVVRAEAEARWQRYDDEAATFEAALKIARGW